MNTTLMAAVLEAAAFLELSGDDVLDPDVAMTQLEDMVANLQKLPSAERTKLVAFVRLRAESENDEARRAFCASFADSLEIDEE